VILPLAQLYAQQHKHEAAVEAAPLDGADFQGFHPLLVAPI
jgi:hypothetical protein